VNNTADTLMVSHSSITDIINLAPNNIYGNSYTHSTKSTSRRAAFILYGDSLSDSFTVSTLGGKNMQIVFVYDTLTYPYDKFIDAIEDQEVLLYRDTFFINSSNFIPGKTWTVMNKH
jgi:hypothetical protein